MSTVYATGGRLRKQCPACNAWIHSKCGICPACETELITGAKAKLAAKENRIISRYDEGGKGRKQCHGCTKYVGLRVAVCPCGYDFASAKAEEPIKKRSPECQEAYLLMEAMGYNHLNIMYVPRQDERQHNFFTPISMREYDESSVAGWAEDMITHFLGDGYFCSPFCLRYFARQLAPANKVSEVLEHLNSWQGSYYTI